MKANRKFRGDDDAVSPVIAVILMVAITVVLAATVYVWVSGFGSQSSQPAKTISLTSSAALTTLNTTDNLKTYTVASATSGMKWSDITISLDGSSLNCVSQRTGTADEWRISSGGTYATCTSTGPSQVISAGDQFEIYDDGGSLSGKTLRILDSQANSVILTLVVG